MDEPTVAIDVKLPTNSLPEETFNLAWHNQNVFNDQYADVRLGEKQHTAIVSPKRGATRTGSALMPRDVMKKILQHSVEQAIEQLIDSGTVQDLMSRAITHVTKFEAASLGHYNPGGCDFGTTRPAQPNAAELSSSEYGEDIPRTSRLFRSRVCHRVSAYGSAFGCVWVRTSTVHIGMHSSATSGDFETVTSFIFYPASWLKRVGVRSGVEVSMVNGHNGWQFQLSPVRAVPEGSQIFELCKSGQVKFVESLIATGHASVVDTSPKGWTPLHVSLVSIFSNNDGSAWRTYGELTCY